MDAAIDLVDEEKLTAAEAAPLLGVGLRQVYALAASGELGHLKIRRSVRFTRQLIREYLQKCRSTSTKPKNDGATSSRVSLMDADSELQNFFQKRGLAQKRKATPKNKTRNSTPLQLAHSKSSR